MANDIVTRLLMNNSGFVAGARGGQTAMKGLVGTVVGGSRAIMGALAPITGVFAGIFAARAAITGAREAIQNERKLTAVLAATGMAAGLSTKQIQEYAEQRMALTNFDDDTTLGAASVLATFQNISGSMFTETLTAAQNLSTVLGTDLSTAAKTLGMALNDPATGLSRLSRMGVTFTTQQQAQIQAMQEAGDVAGAQSIILGELAAKFGGAAEAVVDPWTQVKNTMGEVAENIGHVVMPSINLLSESLNNMMGGAAGSTGVFMEMGTIAASVFSNMGTVAELAWTQIQLGAVKAGGVIFHFFTETLPTSIVWFADNAGTIFENLVNYTATVFSNMAHNIRRVFEEVWDFIASAGTDAIDLNLRSLTEGFEAKALSLLTVEDRVKSGLEQQLEQTAENLTNQLAEAISTDIVAAQAQRDAVDFAQGMMMDMQDEELPTSAPQSQSQAESSAGALDARTREAVSAVARATNEARNPSVRIQERQLAIQQDMADSLEALVDRPQIQLAVARI